ncbi:WD40/YVTN/BNR-like repeat-containing protein [Nocardioides hungaricus]
MIPFFAIATVIIAISFVSGRKADGEPETGPVVGGDLHALGSLDARTFVGGHAGAGSRTDAGGWTQIESLADKDVMGWAASGTVILAGGHAGLYASDDDGSTFDQVDGLPVSDVHALGASSDRVYLASPESGTLVSTDGGTTFEERSTVGKDFMGTIWVDPTNPDVAMAPSMRDGAVKTSDGGATWTPLGSTPGATAVAVDRAGSRVVALSMDGAQVSTDGGASWTAVDVPENSATAAYTPDGNLVVAVLNGDRAAVFQQTGSRWERLT